MLHCFGISAGWAYSLVITILNGRFISDFIIKSKLGIGNIPLEENWTISINWGKWSSVEIPTKSIYIFPGFFDKLVYTINHRQLQVSGRINKFLITWRAILISATWAV
jgi:hypothetical protein